MLLASADCDGTAPLWDPVIAAARGAPLGHTGAVLVLTTVAVPDGTVLLASPPTQLSFCGGA